jgi:hypothetical protein
MAAIISAGVTAKQIPSKEVAYHEIYLMAGQGQSFESILTHLFASDPHIWGSSLLRRFKTGWHRLFAGSYPCPTMATNAPPKHATCAIRGRNNPEIAAPASLAGHSLPRKAQSLKRFGCGWNDSFEFVNQCLLPNPSAERVFAPACRKLPGSALALPCPSASLSKLTPQVDAATMLPDRQSRK